MPPRPVRRRQPDQRALQVVTAPLGKNRCGRLVLHPFGDGLKTKAAGEVDQRMHKGAVIVGAVEILHERAIDLDEIDAKLAQIAE